MKKRDPEFVALLDKWCNLESTPEEVERLEEILEASPEARRDFRQVMNLHSELHYLTEESEEMREALLFPSSRAESSQRFRNVGWALAALLMLLLVLSKVFNFGAQQRNDSPTPLAGGSISTEIVGILVNQSGARFKGMEGELPIGFQEGSYELEGGIVHLRLINGVDVVLRGPAQFGIRDEMNMTLASGVVRAIVPTTGQGFVISAPQIVYEDLGTEFGLSVMGEASEMHVFTGQVNARRSREGEVLSSVFSGESFLHDGHGTKLERAASTISFPSPEDIGYRSWLKNRPDETTRDGMIAYFPFLLENANENLLENVIGTQAGEQVVSGGLISGARWVSGRWPEKGALLFDREEDYVELDISGEFEEISMSVWVNIDRLDHAVNSIFTSNGWSEGDFHWQVLRTQDPILAVHEIPESGPLLKRPIRLARWIHLAAVISKTSGRTRYYVNGQLAQENRLPLDVLIEPGKARLGNWLQEEEAIFPKRSLKARIDELAIWNRALTEKEIGTLVRDGAPSLLSPRKKLESVERVTQVAAFRRAVRERKAKE